MPPIIAPAEFNEQYLLALCIWREMRGRSQEERLGCYWVIRNRKDDRAGRWPKSFAGVITQRWQFSSFNVGDPNQAKWPVPDGGSPDWRAWFDIIAFINGQIPPDPTNGATHYESCPAGKQRPGWCKAADMVKEIGDTRFYRL